jgi:hypothetical protein
MVTRKTIPWILAIIAAAAVVEFALGRLLLGPDGRFGWLETNIWSSEQSQRVADPYSLSHVLHGVLFYAGLWLLARRLPLPVRLVAAVVLEAAWEVLENSPLIINRYRAVTIALGYTGDSILNSMSDVLMMMAGFVIASRWRVWACVIVVLVVELGMLFTVRDNLTLNIVMLIHPIDAIREWQMAGAPH